MSGLTQMKMSVAAVVVGADLAESFRLKASLKAKDTAKLVDADPQRSPLAEMPNLLGTDGSLVQSEDGSQLVPSFPKKGAALVNTTLKTEAQRNAVIPQFGQKTVALAVAKQKLSQQTKQKAKEQKPFNEVVKDVKKGQETVVKDVKKGQEQMLGAILKGQHAILNGLEDIKNLLKEKDVPKERSNPVGEDTLQQMCRNALSRSRKEALEAELKKSGGKQ